MGWLETFLHFLWPQSCAWCGAPGAALCHQCVAELPPRPAPHCLACGRLAPCPTHGQRFVLQARVPHEGVARDLILKAKYGGWGALARELGRLTVQGIDLPSEPWVVTALPSRYPRRVKGFSETCWLALGVARELKVPTSRLLKWNVRGPRQTELKSAARRRAMARDSFALCGPVPEAIILVDDVSTTGTTLLRAAQTLYGGGAQIVRCLSWSKAS